jgi:catechol 2,3-dioxygenase-like lactoylglutathione lyase family enzyme
MPFAVTGLVPMAHVADVQRSIHFYEELGLVAKSVLKKDDGTPFWAFMKSSNAEIMFSLASGSIAASEQAVLFYLYAKNLVGLREQLLANGIQVSPITHPFYMEKGEMRVEDPDGYVLLIGQSD